MTGAAIEAARSPGTQFDGPRLLCYHKAKHPREGYQRELQEGSAAGGRQREHSSALFGAREPRPIRIEVYEMEDDQVQVALARLLADPQTVAALIDRLPEERAVTLLKAWRMVTFGPRPGAGPGPAPDSR